MTRAVVASSSATPQNTPTGNPRQTAPRHLSNGQGVPTLRDDRWVPPRHLHDRASEEHSARTASGHDLGMGPLREDETESLFELFSEVVEKGEGFPHAPPLTEPMFKETWIDRVSVTIGARLGNELAGAYYLKPNFVGRGSHIANAGYVVAASRRGMGIGRCIVEDSIRRAPLLGFDAIQFNLVFESNPARSLYEQLGWRVVGRLPAAVHGEDCLVYWREVKG
jgi:GNAT superfamily N-acetyltransferase